MGFGVLFISILGGYLFLQRCHWNKYTGNREGGYHLLFRSAVAGACLLAAGWLVEIVVMKWIPPTWCSVQPFPHAIAFSLPLALGPSAAWLVNRCHTEQQASLRAIANNDEALERLLFQVAIYDDFMAEITLESGKVYVGWVMGATAIRDRKYVELFPVVSGYRVPNTHKIVFTTNYFPIIQGLIDREADEDEFEAFRVVFPTAKIISARPFKPDVYDTFQQQPPPGPPFGAQASPAD